MASRLRIFRKATLATLLSALAASQCSWATDTAGTVIFAVGDVWVLSAGATSKRAIKHGESILETDTLLTGADGHIHLRMIDRAFIALRPDSQLKLQEYDFEPSNRAEDRARLLLEKGKMRTVSGKLANRSKERYRLNTPVAAIGVRGTDYTVVTTARQSEVDVLQGGIAMSPFTSTCTADSLGPCSGDSVVNLYAEMKQYYLRLRIGADAPDLMEGRLHNLTRPEDDSSLQRIQPEPDILETPAANENTATDDIDNVDAEQETVLERLDSDGDGVADLVDAFPNDSREQVDTDLDGIGDNTDLDDDNDGLSDIDERQIGTNPLLTDSDGDGVNDNLDSKPTSARGHTLLHNGQVRQVAEPVLQSLEIEQVTLTRATSTGTQGVIYNQTLQGHSPNSDGVLTLQRSMDRTGQVFWGIQGSAVAFDTVQKKQLQDGSYARWSQQNGLNTRLNNYGMSAQQVVEHNNRWTAYYQREDFRPILQNNRQYLSNVNGLQPISTPDINAAFPSLSILYQLSALELQSDQQPSRRIGVSNFNFTMNYANRSFVASLTLLTGDASNPAVDVNFSGSVNESGMAFGGKDDAYIKGFFVNELNQLALLFTAKHNDVEYNGTLIAEQGFYSSEQAEPTFEAYQSTPEADVKWGRWSNFKDITSADEVEQAYPDQLIAHNSTFALLRQQSEVTLPESGAFDFDMVDSEAVLKRGAYIESAHISDGALNINFDQRTFSTQLQVESHSLNNGVTVQAEGVLGENGIFTASPGLDSTTNSHITGALTNQAESAAMIFERDLENGVLSGAVEWAR